MIIVDGFNVYPSEVEGVLYTHAGVRMAAVIGIPDAYHGEVVKACVVPRSADVSVDDLKAHCKKQLAAYKVPVEFELRDSLPQSAVGKILYRVLRDELRGRTDAAEDLSSAERRSSRG
jgi:long-chain acyl-CoA synthetase